VTAAFVRGEHTFLVSGDEYVRYSGADYRLADASYPKPLAGNPDGLPSVPFKAALQMPMAARATSSKPSTFLIMRAFRPDPDQSRWGPHLDQYLAPWRWTPPTAWTISTTLFSGNEIACYHRR